MKKIYLLVMTMFITAQFLHAQSVKFGLQGGVNLPSIAPDALYGGGTNAKAHLNFSIGGYLDLGFSKLSIQPGLILTNKGNLSTTAENLISFGNPVPYEVVHTLSLTYVEIPVNVLYHFEFKPGRIYVGAGPYAAYAISGGIKNKTRQNIYVKSTETEDVKFGSGADQLKRSDYGANILAGIELKNGLVLGLNYGFGLTDLNNSSAKSHNRVASLRVGYLF